MAASTQTTSRILRVLNDGLGANVTDEDLRGVSRLDDILPLDSIAVLEFAIALESEFGIQFAGEQMKREFFNDFASLTKFLDAPPNPPQ